MTLSIIVLFFILLAIAVRNFLPFNFPIWLIMLLGAVVVLLTGQISLANAARAIDFEIIFYLLGVFIIAQALESSGVLELLTEKLFAKSNSAFFALFIIVFFLSFAAALLMNDAIAIIGVPVILQLCRHNKQLAAVLLITLAYAITVGSVLSPIGNPQNLLIAVQSGMESPFVIFFVGLVLPTLINLAILYGVIFLLFRKQLATPIARITPAVVGDLRAAFIAKFIFHLFILLIFAKVILNFFDVNIDFALIAIVASLPIMLFGQKRLALFRELDWGTLVFFIAMFIVMQSVWDSGFFQMWIDRAHVDFVDITWILAISALLSQFISNVPLVALYVPLLQDAGAHVNQFLALAAGSTLAGNVFIFGAASNMIIIQNAEKRGFDGFNIVLFSLVGIPLTIINLLIYALFF